MERQCYNLLLTAPCVLHPHHRRYCRRGGTEHMVCRTVCPFGERTTDYGCALYTIFDACHRIWHYRQQNLSLLALDRQIHPQTSVAFAAQEDWGTQTHPVSRTSRNLQGPTRDLQYLPIGQPLSQARFLSGLCILESRPQSRSSRFPCPIGPVTRPSCRSFFVGTRTNRCKAAVRPETSGSVVAVGCDDTMGG